MTEVSRLAQVTAQLRSHYGSPTWADSSNGWELFLRVLLVGPVEEVSSDIQETLQSPSLRSPQQTTETTAGQLVEVLAKVPRGPQKASLLRIVADWWLKTFGEETSPDWSAPLMSYRESLRKIRGLGPATVDELLTFAAKLPVFPVSRGVIRVAVRHGWLDLPVEDADAQAYFVQGLRDASIDGREFSQLMSRVAEDFCGREPKCEGCPLQPLLPAGGPLNPDSV